MTNTLDELIGKKIVEIRMNEDLLIFKFSDETMAAFETGADCCSQSVFYDFYGVKKLLENGPVISVGELPKRLRDAEARFDEIISDNKGYQESIESYGYEIVTEHPEFGPQTSVFSFRNYSNGYYGGWMNHHSGDLDIQSVTVITDDVFCTDQSHD